MSAIAESLNRLTVSLHLLKTAVAEGDAVRGPPAKIPDQLREVSERACFDAEAIDLNAAINIMDHLSCMCRSRARGIEAITAAIRASLPNVRNYRRA